MAKKKTTKKDATEVVPIGTDKEESVIEIPRTEEPNLGMPIVEIPDKPTLTKDGLGLATKVSDINRYVEPTALYKLSHPAEGYSYAIATNGKEVSGPQSVTIWGSSEEGAMDMKPIGIYQEVSIEEAFKQLGYRLVIK